MTPVRRLARPLLASTFVADGVDAWRNPEPRLPVMGPLADRLGQLSPSLPGDPRLLIKVGAAAQLGAAALLTLGRLPRLSALVLAVTLLPRAYAESPLAPHGEPRPATADTNDDPLAATLKNAGLLGGLLLAAVDTGGSPSLAWRARHAGKDTQRTVRAQRRQARMAARLAEARVRNRLRA